MMKKIVSAAMIAALALSVAACGGGDKKKDAPKDGAKPAATATAKVDRSKEFITVLTGRHPDRQRRTGHCHVRLRNPGCGRLRRL